jgi:hypothetical protein
LIFFDCFLILLKEHRHSILVALHFFFGAVIFDKYDRPVASMAVLADDNPRWKPQEFVSEVLACRVGIHFPIAKLTDYAGQEQPLVYQSNPFAVVTLAQHAQRQRHDHRPDHGQNGR